MFRLEQSAPEQLESVRAQLDALQRERTLLLDRIGLKESDLTVRYACPHCSDTGFLADGTACNCYRKLVTKLKLEELGISAAPFHRFSEANPAYLPKTDYKAKFCDTFPSEKQILLFGGKTGTGKTYLASCIAGELEANGFSVIFLSSFSLNRYFMQCFEAENYRGLFRLMDSDLLVIDDLGAEPIYKKITVEYLKNVLDERIARKHCTIITTNLSQAELTQRYTERISSRLFDASLAHCNFRFTGDDLRKKF